MNLVLVTYNIRFGGRRRRRQIVEVLSGLGPDVVMLQEASDLATVENIGREVGLPTVIAEPGRSVAALSRRPIAAASRHRLPTGGDVLEVRLSAPSLRLFGVHFTAGLSRRGERRRLLEVAKLLDLAGTTDPVAPTVLLGDFNAVAPGDGPFVRLMPLWIRTLLRFDGGVRTEVMTTLREAGFVDAFRVMDASAAGLTMPAWAPSVRLDYLMLDRSLVGRLVSCGSIEPGPRAAAASDHLPLVAELAMADEEPRDTPGVRASAHEPSAVPYAPAPGGTPRPPGA